MIKYSQLKELMRERDLLAAIVRDRKKSLGEQNELLSQEEERLIALNKKLRSMGVIVDNE
jgi:hypothetical protein